MPGHSLLQCIYCLETKPVAEFNREHVFPVAFGSFRDALVLGDSVCEGCNTYFGHSLDLMLARGSDEGYQRYVWNVRPSHKIEQFRYDGVTFRYNEEGDYRGCLLRLTSDPEAPNGFRATVIDQVGFSRNDGDGFVWLPLAEVYEGNWLDRDDLNPQAGVKIYAEDHTAVRVYLEEQGVSFRRWRPMVPQGESGDEASVLQVAEFTKDILRAIAKISYNYLAYTNGAQVVLRAQFRRLRRFVRYGEDGVDLIHIDYKSPIPLLPDTPDGHRPVIHVVTVETAIDTDAVIGQVSLFGGARYQIVLSEQLVEDLRFSGHIYNVQDCCTYELGNRRQQ